MVNEWDPELWNEVSEVKNKLETVIDRVRFLLEKYPEARNSDFYLTILYIRRFVPELAKYIKFIPYKVIRRYEGLFESIRRARQKVQERGEFLPTDPQVLKRRRKLAQLYRKTIPQLG